MCLLDIRSLGITFAAALWRTGVVQVAALTFTISPTAEFSYSMPKRVSTRDVLWRAQNSKLRKPLEVEPKDLNTKTPSTGGGAVPTPPGGPLANVSCPSNAVSKVRNITYKRYLISTTLRQNGTWVASFGRPEIKWPSDNGDLAVAETEPYLAESLALADARTSIDDRRRGQPAPPFAGRRNVDRRASVSAWCSKHSWLPAFDNRTPKGRT